LRLEIERDARPVNLQGIRDFIEDACRRAGVERSAAFDLKLAVDEACSNVVEHGYAGMAPGPIRITFDADGDRVVVAIADRGRAFDPKDAAAPDLDSDWEVRRIGGLGWHLIRRSVEPNTVSAGDIARTRGGNGKFRVDVRRNNLLELQSCSARCVLFSGMVLLFNERFVFGKLREHLGREVGNSIKQIHTDRKIRTKYHRAVFISDDLFDIVESLVPSRRPLN
jgi:serine/threonine-protein kinase RsbW